MRCCRRGVRSRFRCAIPVDKRLGKDRAMTKTNLYSAVSLAALVLLHPLMDALLDAPRRVVLDGDRFYSLHRVYLIVSTVQWLAGLVCLIWLLQPPQRR